MIYRNIDGKWVRANLRADYPNTSWPRDLSRTSLPEGYIWVELSPAPGTDAYHRVVPADPVQGDDGVWRQGWKLEALTTEEIQAILVNAIQQHLDATAQARAYDGILSLCTYASSPSPKFAAEGQAGVEWRDACWTKGYQILAGCQAGTRPIPTPEALIAELPAMSWPE